jgi:spatacsin
VIACLQVPGLKLALLEFVRSHCAQDRELLRLVALHFRLYSEVAELWENEACATIHSLLNVTRLELGSNKTSTRIAYGTPTPKSLKASPDTAHLLKLAMQNFSHAAEYYLQVTLYPFTFFHVAMAKRSNNA